MRDRLIELIKEAELKETYTTSDGKPVTSIHRRIVDMSEVNVLADYLLANGVIVPPCKVGDTVWHIDITGFDKDMLPIREVIPFIVPDLEWVLTKYFIFSRFYYLTKEEAEKALKGGVE